MSALDEHADSHLFYCDEKDADCNCSQPEAAAELKELREWVEKAGSVLWKLEWDARVNHTMIGTVYLVYCSYCGERTPNHQANCDLNNLLQSRHISARSE